MADDADRAQQDAEVYASTIKTNYSIPVGEPGECDLCGEWKERLIGGMCARCRDRYKLD